MAGYCEHDNEFSPYTKFWKLFPPGLTELRDGVSKAPTS
jgi:hypothetical protein